MHSNGREKHFKNHYHHSQRVKILKTLMNVVPLNYSTYYPLCIVHAVGYVTGTFLTRMGFTHVIISVVSCHQDVKC